MSHLKKLALCLATAAFVAMFTLALSAQDNTMAKQDNMGNSNHMSVTGCLKQGSDKGGYYIVGDDGKTYELWGNGLSAHVNHKVTVTGTQEKVASDMESQRESAEKQEANGTTTVDLKVHHIKMISENCQ
jgi:hypothetical protein